MAQAERHDTRAGKRQRRALGWLAALLPLFLALSFMVHSPAMLAFDLHFTTWLQDHRHDHLDTAARTITKLGDTPPLIGLGVITGAILAFYRLVWAGVFSALIPPVVLLLNVLIKELIGRPRPQDTVVHQLLTPIGLSFPSGHAMAPAVFFGFLAFMAWAYLRRGWQRTLGVVIPILLILLIGLSRVYLGVHWLSDVIGGWTGGLLVLILTDLLYQRITAQQAAQNRPGT